MEIINRIYKNLDNKERKDALLVLFAIITLLILDFLSIGLIFPLISSIFNDQFYYEITQKPFFLGWEKKKINLFLFRHYFHSVFTQKLNIFTIQFF